MYHRAILFDSPLRESDEREYVRQVLARFMTKAWRRPVEDREVEKRTQFFYTLLPEFPSFEEAMQETLALILIAPEFLYLVEPAGEKKRPLDEWELVSRLSYFLWSSLPDESLTQLAANREILNETVLLEQVERMLEDSRSKNMLDQFATQWLGLDGMDRIAINPSYYPKFENDLRGEIREETLRYFEYLMKEDLSALNLIDSDFTMLNERLARHYQVAGVKGIEFRAVKLDRETRRGGVLTHSSVLLANSTGEDSNPIKRAVFIRKTLLDDPPAPPPPNVPELESKNSDVAKLSIREQLIAHRDVDACADCHDDIDPWGIALEHFDAIGQWRETIRRRTPGSNKWVEHEVVASDALPDGSRIDGVNQLKQYLLEQRKEDFTRTIVKKMVTYALGRSLELSDHATIDRLHESFEREGYRMRGLVKQIVASESFRVK